MDLETQNVEAWLPWSAADARAALRRLSASEDQLLLGYIQAATRFVERRVKRSILSRTLRLWLPTWPDAYLELPAPPLRYAADSAPETAITLEYRNAAGTWVTTPSGVLALEKRAQVWALARGDEPLPTLYEDARAVRVTFAVGWRDQAHLAEDAPDLRHAIMLIATHYDANREATAVEPRVMNVSKKVELAFDDLVRPYVVATRHLPLWV